MNLKKLVIIGISGIIILISSATFLIELIFPPDRIKSFVLNEIGEYTNRQVTIEEVGFSWWGGLGIEVIGVVIDERSAFSSRGPFIKLDRFLLHVEFWPLLDQALVINELVFDQPEISIIFGEDGEANFSDLMVADTTSEASASPVTSVESPLSVELSAIRIENGVIRYYDAGLDQSIELRDIDNQLALRMETDSRINVDGLLSVNEFKVQGPDGEINWNIQLAYRSAINPPAHTITIESLAISLEELGLNLTGQITNYDLERPLVDLTVASSDISIEKAIASLPSGFLTDLSGTKGAGRISIEGRVKGPIAPGLIPDIFAQINLDDGRLETPDLPVPITNLSCQIEIKDGRADIRAFSAQAGTSDLSITGTFHDIFGNVSSRPAIDLTIHSDVLNLDELIPVVEEETAVPFVALPDIVVKAEGTGDRVLIQGLELTNAKLSIAMQDQMIKLTDLTADAYGGQLSGSITQDFTDLTHPNVVMDIGIDKVKADEILSSILPVKQILSGTISTNFSGVSALDSIGNPLINALTVLGSLSIEGGQITNWPPLRQLSSWLKVPDVETIDFKSLAGGLQIEDGRLLSNHLQLTGPKTEWIAAGSAGLDGSMDYQMQLTFSEALSAKVGDNLSGHALSLFKDDRGRIGVHFRVGGTITDPSFSWDSGALKKQVTDRVSQEAKRFVEGQKSNLLGQSVLTTANTDTLKQQAKTVTDSLKSDISGVKDKAKNTLKGLLKRN